MLQSWAAVVIMSMSIEGEKFAACLSSLFLPQISIISKLRSEDSNLAQDTLDASLGKTMLSSIALLGCFARNPLREIRSENVSKGVAGVH